MRLNLDSHAITLNFPACGQKFDAGAVSTRMRRETLGTADHQKNAPAGEPARGTKPPTEGGGNRREEKKRGCASGGCAWQGLSAVYMVERYFQAAFSRVLDQEPRFVWRELVFARLVKRDHRLRDLQHAGDPTLGEAKMFSDFSECCHWHII